MLLLQYPLLWHKSYHHCVQILLQLVNVAIIVYKKQGCHCCDVNVTDTTYMQLQLLLIANAAVTL